MLIPIRSKNPPESFPFVTILLMAANVIVYACTSNGLEIKKKSLESLAITGHTFDFPHLISSMFLHAGIFHLAGNMLFLYLFGFAVEGRMRSFKFFLLYMLSGVAGSGLHYLFEGRLHPEIPSLGASGAIMGVLGAALVIFPFSKVTFLYGYSYH